jgi:hypothetical protein
VLDEPLALTLNDGRKRLVHTAAAFLDHHAVVVVRVDEDVRGAGQGAADEIPIHLARAKEPVQFDLSVLERSDRFAPPVLWIHRNAKSPHPKKGMRADGIRYFMLVEGSGAVRAETYATVPHRLMVSSALSAKV